MIRFFIQHPNSSSPIVSALILGVVVVLALVAIAIWLDEPAE